MSGARSSSFASWSRSSSPAALLSEQRRPPYGGRWSASAWLPDPLTEGRSHRATVILRLISFLPATVPKGGSFSFLKWLIHWLLKLVAVPVAMDRQSRRTKWLVPGDVAVKLSRNNLGTGLLFLVLTWGPLYKSPGLDCNFLFLWNLVVICTWAYYNKS